MRRCLYQIVLPATILVVIGCGTRGGNTEASVPTEQPLLSSAGNPGPESPKPAYDLPLDIRIEAPEAPDEIQGPSPPVPPGSATSGSLLESIFGAKAKQLGPSE